MHWRSNKNHHQILPSTRTFTHRLVQSSPCPFPRPCFYFLPSFLPSSPPLNHPPMPSLRRGSTASPHHSFSAPRFKSDLASSYPSYPSHPLNDSASIMSRPENQSGEQKIINALVARLVNKVNSIAANITAFRLTYVQQLPCNSGVQLVVLESDAAVQSIIQSLLQLSRTRSSLVVQSLVNVLEMLSKVSTVCDRREQILTS